MDNALPYRFAVLCYLFDEQGRVLLLERGKKPNRGLHSPVGGKVDIAHGESPTACAVREVQEETGLYLEPADLHLTGVVSERGFGDETHWLMFLYEVTRPVSVEWAKNDEGLLKWVDAVELESLAIPETDKRVIWPLFWQYRGRFFAAHIDCTGGKINWRLEQPGDQATVMSSEPALR